MFSIRATWLAGIDPVAAENVRAEFDFEQGHFIYDVEFTADGTEYGYWIQASDGSVVKKIELIGAGGSKTGITAAITQKDARKIALEDAGLTEAEVTISAEKLDTENGVAVYEVDFVKGNVKYEYDINATTGAVYSKSSESTAVPTTEAAAQPSEAETEAANASVSPRQLPQRPRLQAKRRGLRTAATIAISAWKEQRRLRLATRVSPQLRSPSQRQSRILTTACRITTWISIPQPTNMTTRSMRKRVPSWTRAWK